MDIVVSHMMPVGEGLWNRFLAQAQRLGMDEYLAVSSALTQWVICHTEDDEHCEYCGARLFAPAAAASAQPLPAGRPVLRALVVS